MYLLHTLVAQCEYREWERRFNERARHGDFVRRDLELGSIHRASGNTRPRHLAQKLRELLSLVRVTPQVASAD